MSTITTSGTFKDRLPYMIMSVLFTVGVIFCIINTYEFSTLLNNDPTDTLEISHSYTWFLIVCNALFAFLFLLLLIMSVYLAINPKGENWANKLLDKLKVFRKIDSKSLEEAKKKQQEIIDKYIDDALMTKPAAKTSLRGPKITYSCPRDKETVIPVLNEPIKRITFGDFAPYDANKAKMLEKISAPTVVQPLTLDGLKSLYLQKKR
jgi:hypothetical protein